MPCSHTHTHIERFLICFSLGLLPEHLLFLSSFFFLLLSSPSSFCPPSFSPTLSLSSSLPLSLSLSLSHSSSERCQSQEIGIEGKTKIWSEYPKQPYLLQTGPSYATEGFPGGAGIKEPACQWRRHKRHGFNPWSGISPGGGSGIPLLCSCLENPLDRGAWQATVHRVAKSRTRLKRLNTTRSMP